LRRSCDGTAPAATKPESQQNWGASRILAQNPKRVASRTFAITLSNLQPGEYGFLPPGAMSSGHASSSLGKIYSFRFLE